MLWEDVDEEGFVIEEGYVYETPHGRVVTRLGEGGEEVVYEEISAGGECHGGEGYRSRRGEASS